MSEKRPSPGWFQNKTNKQNKNVRKDKLRTMPSINQNKVGRNIPVKSEFHRHTDGQRDIQKDRQSDGQTADRQMGRQ